MHNFARRGFGMLHCITVWLGWIALGLMAFGGMIVALDSLLIAAPYILAMTAAVGIIAASSAVARKQRFRVVAAALLAATSLVAALLLLPLPGRAEKGQKTAPIRLVSFNLYLHNKDPGRAFEWIATQRADLVVLLEVAPEFIPLLEKSLKTFPYRYGCAGNGFCSTMILSRVPARTVRPLANGDAENRQALSAVAARYTIAGRDIALTAVHLERPWPLGDQRASLARLTDAADPVDRTRIVAGDFNSAPWTFALREFAKSTGLRPVSGMLPTWPSGGDVPELFALDQVYLSRCLTLVGIRRGPVLGSDHRPIVAEIEARCGSGEG